MKELTRKQCIDLLELPHHLPLSISMIRKSYLRLSLQFHPDRNPHSDTKEKFQKINDAYHLLIMDPSSSCSASSSSSTTTAMEEILHFFKSQCLPDNWFQTIPDHWFSIHDPKQFFSLLITLLKNSVVVESPTASSRVNHDDAVSPHLYEEIDVSLEDVYHKKYYTIEINRYRPFLSNKTFVIPSFLPRIVFEGEGDCIHGRYGDLIITTRRESHPVFSFDTSNPSQLILHVPLNSLEMYLGSIRYFPHLSGEYLKIHVRPFFYQRYQSSFTFPRLGLWNHHEQRYDDLLILIEIREHHTESSEELLKQMSTTYLLSMEKEIAVTTKEYFL